MHTSKKLTGAVTLLSFLFQAAAFGQFQVAPPGPQAPLYQFAPGSTANGQATVPAYPIANMSFQASIVNVTNKLAQCPKVDADDLVGQAAALAMKKAGSDGNCQSAVVNGKVDTSKFNCKMTCEEPLDFSTAPNCDKYYKEDTWTEKPCNAASVQHSQHTLMDKSAFDNDHAKLEAYIKFNNFKSTKCVSADQGKMNKALEAFSCQSKVLEDAVGAAATQVQQAIQENASKYEEQNDFIRQVKDQTRQVDEFLGPEDGGQGVIGLGGDQFKGLMGLKKSLQAQIPDLTLKEGEFKRQIHIAKDNAENNEQTLEAGRMSVVTGCMRGDTNLGIAGRDSVMCFKPTADGKSHVKGSCGLLESLRSQVEQSAFVNESRSPIKSQTRKDDSNERMALFDSFLTSMMRDMGEYDRNQKIQDGKQKGGDAPANEGMRAPRVGSWKVLANKYDAQMQKLSQITKIDIQRNINAIAGRCFSEANIWKKNEKNFPGSDYRKNKLSIEAANKKISDDLSNSLFQLNSSYGDAIAVLYSGAVTLNRFQCTANDPEKMAACHTDIRTNLTNLLEGNGAITTTRKQILGGPKVPAFDVTCRGINGCITAFQNVRKMKKEQAVAAQEAQQDFVKKGNDFIQTQLTQHGQYLNLIQQSVLKQFAGIKGVLAGMRLDAPDSPKFMEGEPLKHGEGADKLPGPFQNPSDLKKVISQSTQPSGLLNFSDTGVRDMVKSANEKLDKQKADLAEKTKTYNTSLSTMDSLKNSCIKGDVPEFANKTCEDKGAVGNSPSPQACSAIADQCYDSAGNPKVGLPSDKAWVTSLLGLFHNPQYKDNRDIQNALSQLDSTNSSDSDCKKQLDACRQASATKTERYDEIANAVKRNVIAQ